MQAEGLTTAAGVALEGPLLLTPRVFDDGRGFFFESWNQQAFNAAAGDTTFVQNNHSRSSRGVLRGLHYQLPPHPQGKLVRFVVGEIFDVAVDIRRGSVTFGQWAGARLSAENHQQLWVPAGFAHGFLTLSEQAEVLYKTTDFWDRDCERAIRWDDPQLAIAWPVEILAGAESEFTAPSCRRRMPRRRASSSWHLPICSADVRVAASAGLGSDRNHDRSSPVASHWRSSGRRDRHRCGAARAARCWRAGCERGPSRRARVLPWPHQVGGRTPAGERKLPLKAAPPRPSVWVGSPIGSGPAL